MILALLAAALAPAPVNRPVAETERAFAAAAQAEGQWAAFRRFMAPDAIMLAPGVVKAADFLAGRAEAPAAVQWAPARTVTACDGGLALSTGPWVSPSGKQGGHFFTIWRKAADGTWRWIYDGGTTDKAPSARPARASEQRASCVAPPALPPGAEAGGASADGTLRWRLDPAGSAGHRLRVDYSDGGAWRGAVDAIVG